MIEKGENTDDNYKRQILIKTEAERTVKKGRQKKKR